MRPYLAGLGTAVPELTVSQAQALEMARPYGPRTAEEERVQRILYRRTGIRSRASVTLVGPAEAPRPGCMRRRRRSSRRRRPATPWQTRGSIGPPWTTSSS